MYKFLYMIIFYYIIFVLIYIIYFYSLYYRLFFFSLKSVIFLLTYFFVFPIIKLANNTFKRKDVYYGENNWNL